jgi:putative SOS response-associated peptidase YedK
VILESDDYDVWLDPGMTKTEGATEMLKPFDAGQMRSFPVSNRVNHAANDDEECSTPINVAQSQQLLF